MKLRIYGNSLRLRLSRADIQVFVRTGRIEDAVQFTSDSRLSYALESTRSVDQAQVQYNDASIDVLIPTKVAQQWTGSDQVGISFAGEVGPSVLVEKDFRCLHREPGQEYNDVDAFPNPQDFLSASPPANSHEKKTFAPANLGNSTH
jgi:hypothetical protein